MNDWQRRQTPVQIWIQAIKSNVVPLSGILTLFLLAFVVGRPPDAARSGAQRLRLGYFANVTHAP
ncbi:hypothetical protein IL398_24165, partial [Escherichia coli]|nr:hypothetical protein [Escherichia coli]